MKFDLLSHQEQEIYRAYKYSSFEINDCLRNGDHGIFKKFDLNTLDSLIQKYETNEDITLFRVLPLQFMGDLQNGEVYQDRAYLSTTHDKGTRLDFFKDNRVALLEIHCEAGIHLINMELSCDVSGDENEYLLARNSKFEIIDIERITDDNIILQHLDDDRYIASGTDEMVIYKLKTKQS